MVKDKDDSRRGEPESFRKLFAKVALLYALYTVFFVVVIALGVPKLIGCGPLVFIALMFLIFPESKRDLLCK